MLNHGNVKQKDSKRKKNANMRNAEGMLEQQHAK
jgi:hypothetical protein